MRSWQALAALGLCLAAIACSETYAALSTHHALLLPDAWPQPGERTPSLDNLAAAALLFLLACAYTWRPAEGLSDNPDVVLCREQVIRPCPE